jgi:hypothetical protein
MNMDSSRELVSIYVISFIIRLYLIILIDVQTSDVTVLKFSREELNRSLHFALLPDFTGIDQLCPWEMLGYQASDNYFCQKSTHGHSN